MSAIRNGSIRGYVLPQVFALKRHKSLEKLNNWLAGERSPIIESTHFYETEADERLDQGLETVIQAIDNGKKLRIRGLMGDATSVLKLVQFPLTILPVKIIYHRGCFYVAAMTDETHKVVTLQIDQLKMAEGNESFQRTDLVDLVEADLKNRFGVTQNIDNEVYEIKLRFSSVTGDFVKNQFWHHEQDKPIRDGDDWLITFRCGINRELVGWLFQWMSNVRIIGPPELKILYDEQLARMQTVANQAPEEPLTYTNAFSPKEVARQSMNG